jgi:hypothetical protein
MSDIYVVKLEYESGSDNGEVSEIRSAHTTEAGAKSAVQDWMRAHEEN